MRILRAAVVVFFLLSLAQAQRTPPVVVPQVPLPDPTSPVRTQLPRTGGVLGQTACDKSGAVYLQPQFVTDSATNVLPNGEIVRVDPDGNIARFSANQPGSPNSANYVVGHAVDRDGHVFLLTMRPGPGNHVAVLQLSEDSSFISKTDLDREVHPTLFAALPSGDFLVGGTVEQDQKGPEAHKSVLWLFGADGSFKREFLSGSTPETSPKAKRPPDTPPNQDFHSMVIGDDDNVYVVSPGKPVKLQVFDEQGKKQRTLKLDPPPQSRMENTFFVNNGRVVVPYWSLERQDGKAFFKRIFRVYDAQTGIAQVDYVSTFRGDVACLDNNDLIFLMTGEDGVLSLGRASLR